MCVQMNGNANGSFHPPHEVVRFKRREQSGHILDADAVRPKTFELFGLFHIVMQAMDGVEKRER